MDLTLSGVKTVNWLKEVKGVEGLTSADAEMLRSDLTGDNGENGNHPNKLKYPLTTDGPRWTRILKLKR